MKTLEERYAHWQSIMDGYKTSGLSQQRYCEANQIDFKKFKYYRWRLASIAKRELTVTKPEIKLAPVTLKQTGSTNPQKIYVRHPNGIECQIPANISESALFKLLQGFLVC